MMPPDFEHIQVELNMDVDSSEGSVTECAVITLLNSFLSAPASKPKKLIGSYFNVEICGCYAHKAVTPSRVGENSLEFKEATFTGHLDDDSLLDPLLECLSNFEIQLKHLSFGDYVLKDLILLNSLFSDSTFAVREISLNYIEFPRFTSECDFHCLDGLLSKPSLKVFEFKGIRGEKLNDIIIIENELKLITNALTVQVSLGTLESFIYDRYLLYGTDGVEELVRALLRLPQFLRLNCTLRYNPSTFADIANKLWAECANGRTLKPPPQNCRNSLLEVMLEPQGQCK